MGNLFERRRQIGGVEFRSQRIMPGFSLELTGTGADYFAPRHCQIHHRRRLHPGKAAIDHHIHRMLEPLADFLWIQKGQLVIMGSPSASSRPSAIGLSGTRRPMVFFFGCTSRRGTSRVAGSRNVYGPGVSRLRIR